MGSEMCIRDRLNVFFVVLDVVLSQVHDRELVLCLEVRRLDQVEDLHPMASLQRVSAQVLDELDDQVGFFDLLDGGIHKLPLALPADEVVLRQLLIQVLPHLVDRFDDHLGVKLKEGSVVAHLSSLLPIQKNLPKSDCVLVDLLQILEIFGTR